jgi:hypothetical protein
MRVAMCEKAFSSIALRWRRGEEVEEAMSMRRLPPVFAVSRRVVRVRRAARQTPPSPRLRATPTVACYHIRAISSEPPPSCCHKMLKSGMAYCDHRNNKHAEEHVKVSMRNDDSLNEGGKHRVQNMACRPNQVLCVA